MMSRTAVPLLLCFLLLLLLSAARLLLQSLAPLLSGGGCRGSLPLPDPPYFGEIR